MSVPHSSSQLHRTWRSWQGDVGTLEAEQAVEWTQGAPPTSAGLPALMTALHFAAVTRFTAGLVRSRTIHDGIVCRAFDRVPILGFSDLPVASIDGKVVCRWNITGGVFARRPSAAHASGLLTLGITWSAIETGGVEGARCRAWARVEEFPSRFLSARARPVLPWRVIGTVYRTFHAHVVFAYLASLAFTLAAQRA